MSYLSSYGNAFLHPIKAFENAGQRAIGTFQHGGNAYDALKFAFTPQTAYAADSFKSNAPYGINPSAAQQSAIVRNPSLSSPPYDFMAHRSDQPTNTTPYGPTNSYANAPVASNAGSSSNGTGVSSLSGPIQTPYIQAPEPITAPTQINQPVTWNGKQYQSSNDPTLRNDQLAYFTKLHGDSATTIDKAYQSGLITFDERRKALDQNRQSIIDQQNQLGKDYTNNLTNLGNSKQAALGSIQASYAQASPDVVQSSQADYQNKAIDQYNTGLGQLNDAQTANTKSISQNLGNIGAAGDSATAGTAYGDLAASRTGYDTQYQNNLDANNQNLVSQQDQVANQQLAYETAQKQQAADLAAANTTQNKDYAARQASAAGGAVGNYVNDVKTVDPTALLSGLANTYQTFKNQGMNDAQIQSNLRGSLSKSPIDPSKIDAIMNFFYGNFLPQYQASR